MATDFENTIIQRCTDNFTDAIVDVRDVSGGGGNCGINNFSISNRASLRFEKTVKILIFIESLSRN